MRIGQGYDVHALVVGRDLIMGGVKIHHHAGLLGHSDADVLCHALADALLGAAALGDIGQHFPDTDQQYKGANSLVLLQECGLKLEQAGYKIVNADCIIMAQKPKMAPHVAQMRANIAAALGVTAGQIAVKATTTEKLGFVGREEGIAASAVVLIDDLAKV